MKCKLTDANDQTRGGLQWGPGVTHTVTWGGVLCEAGCLHYYEHPTLAVFVDPMHGDFGSDAHLWSVSVAGQTVTDGTKSGAETLTTLERIDLPVLTTEQRIELAIRLSLHVYSEPGYVAWARAWLDGSDRAAESAAARAAESAATKSAAEAAARWAARWAAESAATKSAAEAAEAARRWAAAEAAARWAARWAAKSAAARWAAAEAARSAARAARWAAESAATKWATSPSEFLGWVLAEAEEILR